MPKNQTISENKQDEVKPSEGGRNIVLFSDGTGNSSAKLSKTNVWRMYEALDKSGQSDGKDPIQFAIYDNGVGTSSFRPLMLLGGAFGFGLKRNVLELYEFLCTHYTPKSRIYLIGYSRGAFTMRMLAALIGREGIVRVGFENVETEKDRKRPLVEPADLSDYAKAAYRTLRHEEFNSRNPFIKLFRRVGARFWEWWKFSRRGKPGYASIGKFASEPAPGDAAKASNDKCHIHFMGLFDTVGAYGGPVKELTTAWSWLFWPMEPENWNVSDRVGKVCHALALDEPRDSFTPLLIGEVKTGPNQLGISDADFKKKVRNTEAIKQVWFAGAHGNVGGGYPNDGLSRIPLNWMMEQARDAKLQFSRVVWDRYKESVDCCAPIYDPRRGLGGFYRYKPRSLRELTKSDPKVIIPNVRIHATVFDRIRNIQTYAPVTIDRNVELIGEGHSMLRQHASQLTPQQKEVIQKKVGPSTGIQSAASLEQSLKQLVPDGRNGSNSYLTASGNDHIDKAWDLIWWKRVTYFTAFFVGLFLLLMPLFEQLGWLHQLNTAQQCSSPACLVVPIIETAFGFLPDLLNSWGRSFANHVNLFAVVLLVWIVLLVIGRYQKRSISLQLSQFWQWKLNETNEPDKPSRGMVRTIRNNKTYQALIGTGKKSIFPAFFFLLLIFVGLLAFNQLVLFVRDNSFSSTALCPSSHAATDATAGTDYRLNELCNPTGVNLRAGARYRLALKIDGTTRSPEGRIVWPDEEIESDPVRQHPDDFVQTVLVPLFGFFTQRHPTTPLFNPVLQIGRTNPEFVLLEKDELWAYSDGCWSYHFTAGKTGQSYFYVSDAIFGFLGSEWQPTYDNNKKATGRVWIEELTTETFMPPLPQSCTANGV